jgi:hypothetical protein
MPTVRPRTARRLTVAGAALTLLTAGIAAAWPAEASLTVPSGWTVAWSDDFTGSAGTQPSTANWIYDTGHGYSGGPYNWGTGEIQNYTTSNQNIALDGSGNLRITPIRDGSGNWTSARIESQRSNFKPPTGGVMRIEGRIQMPDPTGASAAGYWPAFWALGAPYRGNYQNWPGIGELDVMENVNGANQVWGTLHCGVNPGGPCNETNGLGSVRACPGSTCTGNFHTYALEWDASVSPQVLRWYVDGVQFHSVSQSAVGSYWSQMAGHNGYFLLLNVAMGGSFPNGVAGYGTPTSSTVSGRPMLVDYVAVLTKGGGSGGTSTPTPTATSGGSRNAYTTIQAESYNAQSGTQLETTTDTGGGQNVAYVTNGDWLRFDGVDFTSSAARTFSARVASGIAGGASGLVEVGLDNPSATPIGSFAVANTGGWQSWRTIPANIAATTGVHTVYLTFTSGQPADFVNVNWLTFTH